MNAANPDFKFMQNPTTGFFDYFYRDPVTNEFKRLQSPDFGAMQTPGIIGMSNQRRSNRRSNRNQNRPV